jgi:hypothetical protein
MDDRSGLFGITGLLGIHCRLLGQADVMVENQGLNSLLALILH